MQRFQINALIVTIIMICWALLCGVISPVGKMRIKENFSEIPMKIAGWTGTNGRVDLLSIEMLKSASILSRNYQNELGENVDLSIVYAFNLGDLHQPEGCMAGTGFQRSKKIPLWITPKGREKHEATAVVFGNNMGEELVMIYWFHIDGKIRPVMDNKWSAFMHAIWSGNKTCAMIKYTAISVTGEEDAIKLALSLAEQMDPYVIDLVKNTNLEFEPSDLALEKAKAEE